MVIMTLFLLIRHGESQANRACFFAGQLDAPLAPLGHQQAQRTAQFIAENYTPHKIFASDLQRARDTGKAVSARLNLPVETDSRLREIYAGDWQGLQFEQILTQYPQEYDIWLHDIGHCICSGGESVAQLGQRVLHALTELAEKYPEKTLVIATHATPIRVLQSILHPHGLARMKNIPWVSNASVTELYYDNGQWRFGAIAQDEHLQSIKTSFAANV